MPADFQRLGRLLSLSAANRAITDIGVAGTDFDSSGNLTIGGTLLAVSAANGASDSTIRADNTSNSATTQDAILEARVGGTSAGNPQMVLTIPSGTTWRVGVKNDATDQFFISTGGSDFTSLRIIALDSATSGKSQGERFRCNGDAFAMTLSNDANGYWNEHTIISTNIVLGGTTAQTGFVHHGIDIRGRTYTRSGASGQVSTYAGVGSIPAIPNQASVTLDLSSAFHAKNPGAITGTLTTLAGIYFEGLTRGSNNYQILMQNGGSEPALFANHVGFYAVDETAEAVLGIVQEAAPQVDADETKFSNKLRVRINGATYYIMLTVT